MKNILYLLAFILLLWSIYNLLSVIFEVPDFKIAKNIRKIGNIKKQKQGLYENMIISISSIIQPFIKINPYKQKKMKTTFFSLGITKSPELFYAEALAKSLIILLIAVLFLFILPLLSIVLLILAVLIYIQSLQKPFELLNKKRKAIEKELPRFCSNIKQELKHRNNVLAILSDYQKNAGEALGEELKITIADMRSSNYENALIRLEGRINSGMLSNIVRGLISVNRGDDNLYYFNNLAMELQKIEINELRLEGTKRPRRIKKYIVLILFSFLGGFFAIVGYQVMEILPKLF